MFLRWQMAEVPARRPVLDGPETVPEHHEHAHDDDVAYESCERVHDLSSFLWK